MKQLSISMPAELTEIARATTAAARFAADCLPEHVAAAGDSGEEFIAAVELAAGEACTNAIRHAPQQKDDPGEVCVDFFSDGIELKVEIRDQNPPFDLDAIPEPDFASVPENGYGIYLMKSLMDEVSCRYQRGWNILVMKKRIPGKEE